MEKGGRRRASYREPDMRQTRKEHRLFLFLPHLFLLPGLAPVIPAQTFAVSPAAYATKESPYLTTRLFGCHLEPRWRHQQIHGDLPGKAGRIIGLAWRRDGHMFNTYSPFSFKARVLLSTASVPPAGIKAGFAGNHGPDLRVVLSGSGGPGTYLKISWPGTSAPPSPPAPFAYQFPFSVPFTFAGNPVCWEMVMVDRDTNVTGQFDLALDQAVGMAGWSFKPTRLDLADLGKGCTATGGSQVAYASCRYDKQGTTWTIHPRVYNMRPIFGGFWFLGVSTTRWGPLSLPCTVPGGTCQLYTDLVVVGSAIGTVTGNAEGPPLHVVEIPLLWGAAVHCQWAGYDPGLPMGILLSRAQTWRFPDGGASIPAKADYLGPGNGLVTRFTFR